MKEKWKWPVSTLRHILEKNMKRKETSGSVIPCLVMENVMRKAGVNTSATIFHKSHMPLVYEDDIYIFGQNPRDVTAVFSSFEKDSEKMGLAVTEDKLKIMFSTNKESSQ